MTETAKKNHSSRPLLRRTLVRVGLAIAILSGGSWGTYHLLTRRAAEAEGGGSAVAHSAPSNDELKALFANNSESTTTVDSQATESVPQPTTDRYALPSPSAESAIDAAPPELPPIDSSSTDEIAEQDST